MRLQKLLALALVVVAPVAVRAQNITTVAGGGSTGVAALQYSIGGPEGVIKDGSGNVYILDNFYSRIFKVDTAGNMTIFAGNGTAGFSGDGGLPTAAQLNGPSAMFMDAAGDFFIADSDNSVIREIPFGPGTHYGISMLAGHIYTIAGVAGNQDYNGDGIPANTAFLNVPDGVFVDTLGNLFIGDRFNHIVREVPAVTVVTTNPVRTLTAGNMYTIAGTVPTGGVRNPGFSGDGGTATLSKLHDPWGVYGDSNGNLFIADSSNNAIREIAGTTPSPIGPVTPVAGDIYTVVNTAGTKGTNDSVAATLGQLNTPHGVFFDAAGNLFISDYENHAIREVAAAAATNYGILMVKGNIYEVLGASPLGTKGNSPDGTSAHTAALAHPSNVFIDGSGSGNIFVADSDADTVREVPVADGTNYGVSMTGLHIYTIAGNGFLSFGGDGAIATNAELDAPFAATNAIGIATDATGNLFIADTSNDVIREVTGGNIQTIVGGPGNDSFSGDGGVAASGRINNPNGVFVDSHNNIFIADTGNCLIREVVAATGNITTVAGTVPVPNTNPPSCGPFGDQGPATTAQLNAPNAVFVDGSGNIFIADTLNHAIREIPAVTANGKIAGHIYTVAGTLNMSGPSADGVLATGALLHGPQGVFVDSLGNLFIADTNNQVVREVPARDGTNYSISMAAGKIYTVAGTGETGGFGGDGGPATSAKLLTPFGVLVDDGGNIFISDTGNHLIREVASSTGHISTIAGAPPSGTPVGGFGGDGLAAASAVLNAPQGLAAGITRNLLVADSQNIRIRSIGPNLLAAPAPAATLDNTTLTFTPARLVGTTSAAMTVTLTDNGTAPLTITSITITGTNSADFAKSADTCPKSPTKLALGANCTISVKFTPTANGTRNGAITIIDDAANSPQTVTLKGTGGTPTATPNPASLTFASQFVGTASTPQAITLTNSGAVTLNVTNIGVSGTNSGDFALTPANTCVGTPVAANGGTCTINVTFTPIAAGNNRIALITITDDASPATETINLTGTAVAPAVGLSTTGLTFAAQLLNTPSAAQSVTVTNNGSAALNVTNVGISGPNSADFALTPANPCGTPVAANGGTCIISVTFTPSGNGSRTAHVTITDNANPTTQVFAIGGTGGTPTADLTSPNLTFSNQVLSTLSAAQTVTLTNNGAVALTVTNIGISSTNSADFAQTNTCGTSVAAAANCTISVTFTPGATGSRTALVTIADNATSGTQTISLTGTGVLAPPAVSLSGANLAFSDQLVGTPASPAQTVILTNNGKSPLTITSIAVSTGDFAETDTCPKSPATVAANGTCVISATFAPSASGARSATVTITDNAAGSPRTVSLGGAGVALSLAAASSGSTTQTVKAGQTATYNLQLSAAGAASMTDSFSVTVTCTGAPSLATCNAPTAPVVVTPAGPAAFSITVSTTGASIVAPGVQSEPRMQPPAAIRTLPLFLLALLSVAVMLAWMQSPAGRMRTVRLAFVAGLLMLPVSAAVLLQGCASGGGSSTPTPKPSTPAGTSTLTITATANGKAQTTTLTLIVQ
jgi:sugar lactone lactonase YvrE